MLYPWRKPSRPKKVLLGSGKQTRLIRLNSADALERSEIKTLLKFAASEAKPPLPVVGRGRLVIGSVSQDSRGLKAGNRYLTLPRQNQATVEEKESLEES